MTEAKPCTSSHIILCKPDSWLPHCESRVKSCCSSLVTTTAHVHLPCIPPAVTRHRPAGATSFSRFRDALAATLAQCVVDPEHDTPCSHLAWRMRCPVLVVAVPHSCSTPWCPHPEVYARCRDSGQRRAYGVMTRCTRTAFLVVASPCLLSMRTTQRMALETRTRHKPRFQVTAAECMICGTATAHTRVIPSVHHVSAQVFDYELQRQPVPRATSVLARRSTTQCVHRRQPEPCATT
jgi:hypothetical protein